MIEFRIKGKAILTYELIVNGKVFEYKRGKKHSQATAGEESTPTFLVGSSKDAKYHTATILDQHLRGQSGVLMRSKRLMRLFISSKMLM